jgi:hypothetical protein
VEDLYREYKDNKDIAIYVIYIREAHPVSNPTAERHVAKHKTIDDRINAALKCMKGLRLSAPVLIDGLDYKVQNAYRASYACTTVIDKQGNIAFHARGPRGTQPQEARKCIKALLAEEKK